MRRFLISAFFILITKIVISQCTGAQTYTLNPAPPVGGYSPGTVVTVCYTMQNWSGTNFQSNWLEGFDINLGPGWTNLTPLAPPINCDGGGGTWLWMNTTTGTGSGITVGPGWFFEGPAGGPIDGNPGNDWGDFGTTCAWSFCFNVTVSPNCNQQNLQVQVTAGADGTWGSWGNNACLQNPLNIYNGTSNAQLPPLGSIFHN
jgi:hypothetical protein